MTKPELNLLTLAEAAEHLNVHPRTVRRRIADGTLTGYRVGSHLIRLDSAEVDRLLRPIPSVRMPRPPAPETKKTGTYVGRHERPES